MREVLEASGARDSGLPQRTEEHWIQETARCRRFWRLQGREIQGFPSALRSIGFSRLAAREVQETPGARDSGAPVKENYWAPGDHNSASPRGSLPLLVHVEDHAKDAKAGQCLASRSSGTVSKGEQPWSRG